MKNLLIYIFCCGYAVLFGQTTPDNLNINRLGQSSGFIENKGQIIDQNGQPNPAVKYLRVLPSLQVQIRDNGYSYEVKKELGREESPKGHGLKDRKTADRITYGIHRVDIGFKGANPHINWEASEPQEGYLNYYTTGTPEAGIHNVRSYRRLIAHDVWDKIDVEFLVPDGVDQAVKYNIIVRPGGNPAAVQLRVAGADETSVSASGGLLLTTAYGNLEETIPLSYTEQMDKSNRETVEVQFSQVEKDVFGFQVPGGFSANGKTLVIDPVPDRVWGTYYGGSGDDYGNRSAIDANGNIFLGGQTTSSNNIATTGAHQNTLSGTGKDGFLIKFNTSGIRQWATYLGGTGNEENISVSADANNSIFIAGVTASISNIATTGAHQTSNMGASDAFIVKFSTNGIRQWGTYYGGTNDDIGYECVVDINGNIILTGNTFSSTGIATTGSHQSNINGSNDGFLVKFNSNGIRQWGTYFGGGVSDDCRICTVDNNASIYIGGMTASPSGVASIGAHQTTLASDLDAFIVKFSADGVKQWGTYYGGLGQDKSWACKTDNNNNVILIGETESTSAIATAGAYQSNYGGGFRDAFIVKFNTNGIRQWGTYYGGSGDDRGYGCTSDNNNNNFYLTGWTSSTSGISTAGSYQFTHGGGFDVFITKLNTNGVRQWASYYGGVNYEWNYGCSITSNNELVVSGYCQASNNITSPGAHQTTFGGGTFDAFLVKLTQINCTLSASITNTTATCTGQSTGTATVTSSGGTSYSYLWSNGQSASTATSLAAGSYTVTVTDTGSGCTATAVATITNPPATISGFTYTVSDQFVYLTNTSSNANSYYWTFNNNGSHSNEVNPVFNYSASGTYLICLLATGTCNNQAQVCEIVTISISNTGNCWQLIDDSTEYFAHYGVHFSNPQIGWAVGIGGKISKTTSGGNDWTPQSSNTTNNLSDVSFYNDSIGWAIGLAGTILKTINGGAQWLAQASNTPYNLFKCSFISAQIGWIVGDNGVILKTTDGGDHWIPQTSNTTKFLYNVHFINSNTGWAVAGSTILKTTDGGEHWISSNFSDTNGYLYSVFFLDSNNGFIAGSSYKIWKTTDGGANWQLKHNYSGMGNPNSKDILSLKFLDAQNGWAVGNSNDNSQRGPILRTKDGGESWIDEFDGTIPATLGFPLSIFDIFMFSAESGIGVGGPSGPNKSGVVKFGISAPFTQNITYCKNAPALPLTATGTSLLWYPDQTGGTGNASAPVPNTANIGSTTYYVTQTPIGTIGCGESERSALVVTVGESISATIGQTVPACSGLNSGSATITPSGGSNFTYKWSNNQTTATVINVAAGTYTVTVTGSNGCTATATATVGSLPGGIDCGLVARYKLDETTNDISGNANNGTTPNGITYVEDKFGNCKGAARFNGTNTYVSIPPSNSLNSPAGSITLMGWAKALSPNIQSILCKSFSSTSTLHYRLGVNGTGTDKIFFGYRMEGQAWGNINSIQLTNLNLADWNHYAVTWDGTTVRFFWNGVEKGSGIALTGILQPNDATTPLELGRDIHGGAEYFNGDLDELRIYHRALSSSEIQQLFNATGDVPLSATVSLPITPACSGQTNGSATVTATGGATPYTYKWTNNQTTATVINVAAGIYTVTVTGSNGCSATAIATISSTPATTAGFTSTLNGSTASFANTSTNANTFTWDFGNGQTSIQPNPTITYTKPGQYQVCLTATGLCGSKTTCHSVVINPPGWDPIVCNTGIVHTIAVWDTAITNIAGQPLEVGDFVGFFHTDITGANVCNNAGVWTGTTLILNVCGDDPATSGVKEGYGIGENFLVRVWKDTTEHNVIACYVPKDTYGANDPNATGSFAPFGLSYIECLKTSPPPGTALGCSSPIPIACGETKTGNTSIGTSAAISYNCFFNLVDGPEVVYEFINPVTQNVLITLTNLQEDLEVLLLDACDRNNCIRFSDRTGKIPEALLANNLPAGTYFIIVEGYLGSDSPYTLHVTCGSNTTVNGTFDCTGALAAQCGQTITGNTNTGSDQIVQYGCNATYNSGKEKIYTLTLPENKVVSARLFGLSADLNLIALNACDPAACFASSSRSGTEDDGVLFYATAGKTYYFVVDGYFDAEGPYSLSFSCWDPCTDCPTDYDLNGSDSTGTGPCQTAQVLQCGIPVSGNNSTGNAFADYYSCPNSYTYGKEVIYKFTIDETQDVTLILSGLSANLDLYLLDDCSVFNCHAASHKTGTSDEGMVLQALAAGTYYVVVDGFNGAVSGYSLVVNCSKSTLNCQTIDLVKGANFISSNILPIDPAIDAMFAPSAQSKIISIESQGNLSYSPIAQTDPKAFGDWDFRKAYRIKTLEPVSVEVCGKKADPDTPIPFIAKTPQGAALNNWSAYLKDEPAQVGDKFTPVLTPKIFRVWNMPTGPTGTLNPQSWLVTAQGGTNFQLKTGRGYILNAKEDGEYSFGFWSGGVTDRGDDMNLPLIVENGCAHFQTPFFNSMKAATVILPKIVLEQKLASGDEIGIFRQDGSLFGSGKYNGFALSIVVGGDETATPDFSEGFAEGETMAFRLWKAAEGKDYDLKTSFQSGNGDFENEAVFVVSGLEALEVSAVQTPKAAQEWAVYPNPARETVWFDLFLPQRSDVHLELFSVDGGQVRDIAQREMPAGRTVFYAETGNLASGCYLVKMSTEQGVSFKKIIISKK